MLPKRAILIGYNALGDTLCTTAAVRAFRESHPDTYITYVVQDVEYCRVLEACPGIDTVIYSEVMYIHGLKEFSMEWLTSLALDVSEETNLYHFSMEKMALLPNLYSLHLAEALATSAGLPISSTPPWIEIGPQDIARTKPFVRKPYAVISMHSVTNPPRPDGKEGGMKDWPWDRWTEFARRLRQDLDLDVIALGSERNMRPHMPEIRTLYGLPIRTVAAMMRGAECMISLENGLAHLAAGLDIPLVHLYSPMVPLTWAMHQGLRNYEVIFQDPYEVSAKDVLERVQAVLARRAVAV